MTSTIFATMEGPGAALTAPVLAEPGKGSDVSKTTCSVDGCGRPHKAKGWCDLHYHRWARHDDPLVVAQSRRSADPCSVAVCDRPVVAGGLCGGHYQRARRNGGDPGVDAVGVRPRGYQFHETVLERFWANIPADYLGDECAEWRGDRTEDGYGVYRVGRRASVLTHRFVVEVTTGEQIPAGLQVCHHCDNPPCCRFDHLFIGTNLDNSWDMSRKGRARAQRLTPAEVLSIRSAPADVPHPVLAERYGVSRSLIGLVRTGKVWRHLLDDPG